jgi:hypothetical protein
MPQNTSRGYPYPIYTDFPKNFPASIQALATAIDSDVTALQSFVAGARDRPCMMITQSTAQNIPNNTTTAITWAASPIRYDNTGIFTPPAGMTLTQRGIYLLSCSVTLNQVGSGGVFSVSLSMASSAGIIPLPVQNTIRADPDNPTWANVSVLHYVTGAVPDVITMSLWHNQGATQVTGLKTLTAAKISNTLGGS